MLSVTTRLSAGVHFDKYITYLSSIIFALQISYVNVPVIKNGTPHYQAGQDSEVTLFTNYSTVSQRHDKNDQLVATLLHPTQRQQYCLMLTAMNNMGSTAMFNPVILHAQNFWLCSERFSLIDSFDLHNITVHEKHRKF